MSCAQQRKVDLHFEQKISASEEHAMREHLPGCSTCRQRYERHLLLERLDPAAKGAGPRLARGLGLERPTGLGRLRILSKPQMGMVGALAVAACVALLLQRPMTGTGLDNGGFSARGGSRASNDETAVTVFRGTLARDGAPVRAGASIRRGDELAFAYANPGGKRYLVIFGVDEHRHVYWYYPAWTDPSANPTSLPIERTNAPHPLPDAIRHGLDGDVLDIHAVFTDLPLDVRTVERLVAEGNVDRVVEGRQAGAIERPIRFRVEP